MFLIVKFEKKKKCESVFGYFSYLYVNKANADNTPSSRLTHPTISLVEPYMVGPILTI